LAQVEYLGPLEGSKVEYLGPLAESSIQPATGESPQMPGQFVNPFPVAADAAAAISTGLASWIPAGLSMTPFTIEGTQGRGQQVKLRSPSEMAKTAFEIQEALTWKPRTERGAMASETVAAPITWMKEKGEENAKIYDRWEDEATASGDKEIYRALAAASRFGGEAAPFILPIVAKYGSGKVKALVDKPFRSMERVLEPIKETRTARILPEKIEYLGQLKEKVEYLGPLEKTEVPVESPKAETPDAQPKESISVEKQGKIDKPEMSPAEYHDYLMDAQPDLFATMNETAKTLGRNTLELTERYRQLSPEQGKGVEPIIEKVEPVKQETVKEAGVGDAAFQPAEGFERRPTEGGAEQVAPVKRSDIVKFLQEKLDVPIRVGKFRIPGALGIFKVKAEVIRSKMANDIEVIAHEIGHGLNKYLWGMKGKYLETAPLGAFSHELLPIATKARGKQPPIQEGFAEFIRKYITNEAEAKKAAPTFYDFFEKELDLKSPESKEIFIEARNQYDKWIKQPATQRVLGQISIGAKEKKSITWSDLYTKAVDEFHPLKKIVDAITGGDPLQTSKNPYELARLMAGWTGKADAFLEHKTFGFKDYEWKNKSLKDILEPVKGDLDNLRAYMVAKRSLELKDRNIETGISAGDAAQVVREQIKHDPIFKELQKYQDDVLQYLVDSGVLGKNDAIKMKTLNREYVPFYRVMEPSGKGGTGTGFEVSKPTKAIKGSWRDIVDPLESIVKNTYTFIQVAEKNTVMKSLVDLANKYEGMGKFVEKIPESMQKIIVKEPELLGILQKYGKWTETTKYKETQRTVGEKIRNIDAAGEETAGGSTRASELMEQQALEALKARGRTEGEARTILDKIKKAPTNEVKTRIIEREIEKLSVQETVKEFGLDIPDNIIELFRPSAFAPSGNVIGVWKNGKQSYYEVHPDIAKVFKGLDRESTNTLLKVLSYPARWLRAGATLTPEFILRNPLRDQFSALTYTRYGFVPGVDLARGMFHLVKGDNLYWEWKKSGGEHSMLVSLDREYLQKSLDQILKENNATDISKSIVKNPLQALQILSELTESGTRIGEFGKGVKKEGTTKEGLLKSAMASREVTLDFARKGTTGKVVNQLIAFWNANVQGTDKMVRSFKDYPIETSIRVASAITIPSIALYMINRNDPRWDEIPSWQKNLFWIVFTKDNIYRIPKPFELGILFGSVPERILEYADKKNPKLLQSLYKSMAQGAMPGYIPTVAIPLLENWANKSTFMDRPIVPKGREDVKPSYQYQPYTTELAKAIGKGVDKLTMGATGSPAKIENLIRGWSGGIGTYVLNIADLGLRKAGVLPDISKPTKTAADTPILKAFTVRHPSSSAESIQTFYNNYEEVNQIKNTAMALAKKEFKPQEGVDLLRHSDYVNMDRVNQAMSKANQFVQLVYANPKMQPDEKRQIIDKTYLQMIEMAKKANEGFERIKAAKGAKP
jgi:hypothetical protein